MEVDQNNGQQHKGTTEGQETELHAMEVDRLGSDGKQRAGTTEEQEIGRQATDGNQHETQVASQVRDLGHQVASELQDTEMGQNEGNAPVSPFFPFPDGCAIDELRRCATWSSIQTCRYALTLNSAILSSSKATSCFSVPHARKIQT